MLIPGYRLLARTLIEHGVDTVFAVMGDGNLRLLAELTAGKGIRVVHARHEQGAVAMADGYSRLTGKLGVATVTHGPGLTNTATSLATAAAHSSRLLVIAGGLAADDQHNLQRLDQPAFAAVLGADCVSITSPGQMASALSEALRRCGDGRTVLLHAPTDVQLAGCPDVPVTVPAVTTAVPDSPTVAAIAALVGESARPVLLAGRGASTDDAISGISALSDRLGAPIVTTLLAKGNFAGRPAYLGVAGGLGDPAASAALAEADCVLAFGASLNNWTTTGGAFTPGARIIQVDTDPQAFGRFTDPTLAVLGDSARTAAHLLAICRPGARPFRRQVPPAVPDVVSFSSALHPQTACAAVAEALPEDVAVVVDGGHVCIWATQLLGPSRPRSFTHGFSFGSIAQSLPLALGAALGLGGRRVLAVLGDGAAAMCLHEFETAVRTQAPLTVLVLNDGGFGIERHTLVADGLATESADYPAPRFADIATAMGARAIRITDPAGLARLPGYLTGPGPALIDLVVDPAAVSDTFRKIKGLPAPQAIGT
ncbi:thiamine pyrophosphate-binding protein [Amycolatopsis jejuensis]|uniref:thiamine pyrophosphate-binding protein n=1 Tax=Amycolatopsis jejuensis TaxID=330084 RepID=UPI000525D2B8|nr:thiamine pyrophosphate-binding protein [Amycolatopsis jejuensis]